MGMRAGCTEGSLLGGTLRYAQPSRGFRTGIEPVLLAAAVPARPGVRVLEAGTGAGATLLCLAARVAGVHGLGIERDPRLAELATRNLAENGLAERFSVLAADIADLPDAGVFDHACANPPWHDPAGTASPDPARNAAKHAPPELLRLWAEQLAKPLRRGGTLTFILATALLPAALSGLVSAGCGSPTLLPFWPKQGSPAKLVLLQAEKGGAGPCRILPGIALHGAEGRYTMAAEAVLRHGEPIPIRSSGRLLCARSPIRNADELRKNGNLDARR